MFYNNVKVFTVSFDQFKLKKKKNTVQKFGVIVFLQYNIVYYRM